jgi:D-arabinose 1-dehydrogenase-like Zn-dependent alcohol dehydrogenase
MMIIDGVLCCVGAPNQMTFTPFKAIFNRLNICGSPIASNSEVRNMLAFW